MSKFFYVYRQKYFPDGNYGVEIAKGDFSAVSPGMLPPLFPEEGIYENPIEAANAAIKVCHTWSMAFKEEKEKPELFVSYGNPFSPSVKDEKQIKEWANKQFSALEKCCVCNQILSSEHFIQDDEKFCSEYCAEMAQTVWE